MVLAALPLASRGFAPRGLIKLIFRVSDFKENFFKNWWGIFSFILEVRGVLPPRKIVMKLPGTYEKPIGSAVSEILRYK